MVVEKTAKQQRNSLLVCSFRNDLEMRIGVGVEERESYTEKDMLRQVCGCFQVSELVRCKRKQMSAWEREHDNPMKV